MNGCASEFTALAVCTHAQSLSSIVLRHNAGSYLIWLMNHNRPLNWQ